MDLDPKAVENIDQVRSLAGIPVKDFCGLIGISRTAYYDWRRGRAQSMRQHHVETLYPILDRLLTAVKTKRLPLSYKTPAAERRKLWREIAGVAEQ